jgi:tripartite ATP-independent transporter DctM subunit
MSALNSDTAAMTGENHPAGRMQKVISSLDKVGVFSRWTNIIGITALFSMIILNFVDVLLDTRLIHHPYKGTTPLTEIMMICGIWLAMAHSQNEKGHLSIDVVTSRLSPLNRLSVDFVAGILSLGAVGIIIWKSIDQSIYFAEKHMMHAQFLAIPSSPFAAIIALGAAAFWLLLFRDFLKIIVDGRQKSLSLIRWAVMIAVPVVLAVLVGLFMQKGYLGISLNLLAIIGIAFFLILMLSGVPLAITMILTAVVFISNIRGSLTAFDMIATDIYRTSGSYSFSVLPFFMLMGFFALHARFGEDLYSAGYKWLGHMRGGLSYATIGACTGFAAIVGDPIASVSTMGSAAYPQMKRYNYNDLLSSGSIVAGSSLGPIIPPSSAFILVGLLTGVPIGSLLISGVLPGLLMAAIFCLLVYGWCRIYPNAGPSGEKSAWGTRFVSLKAGGPVLIVFLVCIGGIYTGIFTPTRGGAVGAFAAFIIALSMKRYNWKNFTQALLDGGKNVSTVFFILVGAQMFTRFLAWCNLTNNMTSFINGLGMSPTSFMIASLVFFAIMGCFIDILPMILIGFPIFFPIASALGINPIWFCLLTVIVINLGGMTPPVGIIMFVLKNIRKEIPINTIYKGTLPFVFATIVAIAIIFLVPSLGTWLPNLIK